VSGQARDSTVQRFLGSLTALHGPTQIESHGSWHNQNRCALHSCAFFSRGSLCFADKRLRVRCTEKTGREGRGASGGSALRASSRRLGSSGSVRRPLAGPWLELGITVVANKAGRNSRHPCVRSHTDTHSHSPPGQRPSSESLLPLLCGTGRVGHHKRGEQGSTQLSTCARRHAENKRSRRFGRIILLIIVRPCIIICKYVSMV